MRGGVVGMSRKEFFEYLPSFSLVTFGITDEYGADERTLRVGGKPVDLLKPIERLTFQTRAKEFRATVVENGRMGMRFLGTVWNRPSFSMDLLRLLLVLR
jgi:hypothetical protein